MVTWNEYDIYVQNGKRVILWGTVYDESYAKEYAQLIGGWYKVRQEDGFYAYDEDIAFAV